MNNEKSILKKYDFKVLKKHFEEVGNGSQSEFARHLGVNTSQVCHWLKQLETATTKRNNALYKGGSNAVRLMFAMYFSTKVFEDQVKSDTLKEVKHAFPNLAKEIEERFGRTPLDLRVGQKFIHKALGECEITHNTFDRVLFRVATKKQNRYFDYDEVNILETIKIQRK